jgi:hypothetical protein
VSIIDRWYVKDHCVDCGLPCIRTACPHYASGVTVRCDMCGAEWDAETNAPETSEDYGDVHLCERCAANGGKAAQA